MPVLKEQKQARFPLSGSFIRFTTKLNVMSLISNQRQSDIEKRRHGCHSFASGSAEMNDDFSGPPGMDARRARSDRDVAWARGQEKSRE